MSKLTLNEFYEAREDIFRDCPACHGTGFVHVGFGGVFGLMMPASLAIVITDCGVCGGAGRVYEPMEN